jgi:hypothetical protein
MREAQLVKRYRLRQGANLGQRACVDHREVDLDATARACQSEIDRRFASGLQ